MQKTNKLSYAVIGVGYMGSRHVDVLSKLNTIKLVAVADPNRQQGGKIASTYKTSYYFDYIEMLQKENIDAVSICPPTVFHFEIAKTCIQRKINVLLEKPITLNIKQAEKLLSLAKKYQVKFLVGHIERFNPAVLALKKLIERRLIGEVYSCIAYRTSTSRIKENCLLDLAIHDVDVINFLMESVPTRVIKIIDKHFEKSDIALVYNKVCAYVHTDRLSPIKMRKLLVFGTKKCVEINYFTQELHILGENVKINMSKYENLLENEITYFIKSIKNNMLIDSQFAVDALKIVLQ